MQSSLLVKKLFFDNKTNKVFVNLFQKVIPLTGEMSVEQTKGLGWRGNALPRSPQAAKLLSLKKRRRGRKTVQ